MELNTARKLMRQMPWLQPFLMTYQTPLEKQQETEAGQWFKNLIRFKIRYIAPRPWEKLQLDTNPACYHTLSIDKRIGHFPDAVTYSTVTSFCFRLRVTPQLPLVRYVPSTHTIRKLADELCVNFRNREELILPEAVVVANEVSTRRLGRLVLTLDIYRVPPELTIKNIRGDLRIHA